MSYLRKLLMVEVVALGGLVLSSGVVVAFFALWSLLSDDTVRLDAEGVGALIGFFTIYVIFGVIPVVAFGAPIYALLSQIHRANWISSLVLGLLPGIAFWFIEPALAPFAFFTGAMVAIFTHYLLRDVGNLTTQSSGTSV